MKLEDSLFEESKQERTSNLRRSLFAYTRRWPWIIVSVLLCLFLAWVYTRYTTPTYKSGLKVLIKDDKKNAGTNIILDELGVTNNMNGGIDNEMEILGSEKIIGDVVDRLNLDIAYYKEGNVIESEIYSGEIPVLLKVNVPGVSVDGNYLSTTIDLSVRDTALTAYFPDKTIKTRINKPFKYREFLLTFVPNLKIPKNRRNIDDDYKIKVRDKYKLTKYLQRNLEIEMSNEFGTVLDLYIDSENKRTARDFLNTLIVSYNEDASKDKNLEFENTKDFIERRIKIISDELGEVESQKQSFQQSNDITNYEQEFAAGLAKKANAENELLTIDTELELVKGYNSYIKDKSIDEYLPNSISTNGGGTNAAVTKYNELVSERNALLARSATEDHPFVKPLTEELQDARRAILENVSKERQALLDSRNLLQSKLDEANSLKSKAPSILRSARGIDRQQLLKENLYLLLLNKREEAAISSAMTTPKAKVIDPAFSSNKPVAPVKNNYFFAALVIGLILPLSIIYSKELLKNKIETREDLEHLAPDVPIVSEIPRVSGQESEKVVAPDLSALSEAFRILRTNVDFILSNKKAFDEPKVILVTSSIKGEGKTLVSMNFAHTLSQLRNKKVIIIGADIRNPQIHRYNTQKTRKELDGLTEYLYSDNDDIHDYIKKSTLDDKTDIIYSGRIPPNPSELLMSPRFGQMIDELKKEYDYIIIDSAPMILVSDTYHLNRYADLIVYVVRSEYTMKNVINHPIKAKEDGKIGDIAFVINDISTAHSGYGYGYKYNYGYGYGYGTKNRRRSFMNRMLNSFKK